MRALVFQTFRGALEVREVPEPRPAADGVVVRVAATGVCRSDWHAWQGHDTTITELPHVPGHELAGTVAAVGGQVAKWRVGDRVTVPFVNACGRCAQCREGAHQVCAAQRQPGFTHWGSFAELVALDAADVNLVAIPESLSFATAASLGCRFATAYRAVLAQGRAAAGEWVVVHGCGGVGLAAVQVAVAQGCRVVAVDVSPGALAIAGELGAEHTVRPPSVEGVRELTGGGAHLSLDAFGSAETALASLACLRPRGRHVQVGLLAGEPFAVPLGRVLAEELEILGSHGMASHDYPELLRRVAEGELEPGRLVTREISLDEAGEALASVGRSPGVTIVIP